MSFRDGEDDRRGSEWEDDRDGPAPTGGPGGSGGGPSNRQLGWLAVAALAVVIIAVIVIVATTAGSSNSSSRSADDAGSPSTTRSTPVTTTASTATSTTTASTTTTSASTRLTPAGGPVPSGFEPQSFTAISDDVWWSLGSASCGSPPCTSIVRSTDAGRSWVGIPAPRTSQVTGLRFANATDGYAYGQQLWSTSTGGASWVEDSVSGTVEDLSIADGYVYAAMGTGGLLRAAVGSSDFTQVLGGDVPTVWAQGGQVFADEQSASGVPELLSSSDEGNRFSRTAAPQNSVQCSFTTTGEGIIWAPCATGTAGGLWRSTDAGSSWEATRGISASAGTEPNSAAFAAASGEVALYGAQGVYRTTDGGEDWSTVSGLGDGDATTSYLGFTDAEHGIAILESNSGSQSSYRLYASSDGGASFSPVSISAG